MNAPWNPAARAASVSSASRVRTICSGRPATGAAYGIMGTSAVGAIFMFPLSGIIRLCVALRIHPNVLTFIGVCINLAAAWALGRGRFFLAGIMCIAIGLVADLIMRTYYESQAKTTYLLAEVREGPARPSPDGHPGTL